MTKLKSKLNRFFFNNRDRGLRNLMLFLAIGNGVVYLLQALNPEVPAFWNLLVFDRAMILRGQVWRLFSYPLLFLLENGMLWGLIGLFFFYWCGSILEQYWGTLRFNCFWLTGILLTDLAALLLDAGAEVYYVNLSMFLAVATLMPDQQIRIWFVIPVKMKWMAWLDLGLTLFWTVRGVITMIRSLPYGVVYLAWILYWVPVLNYLLYFGKQAANLLPDFLRYHPTRKSWQRAVKNKTVFDDAGLGRAGRRSTGGSGQARFRCTVCGRTELSNPGLEFRYCSRCSGYRCYCEDHIHNHVHITE